MTDQREEEDKEIYCAADCDIKGEIIEDEEEEEAVEVIALKQSPHHSGRKTKSPIRIVTESGTSDLRCFDTDLIEEVKRHSCLYVPHYRDPFLKEKTWRQIARSLNVSTEYCKLRWKSLRDRYVKTVKEEKRRREKGIIKHGRPYRFAAHLAFLKDHVRNRGGKAQLTYAACVDDNEDEDAIYQNNLSDTAKEDEDEGSVEDQRWAAASDSISSTSSRHTNNDQQQANAHHHLINNSKQPHAAKGSRMESSGHDEALNYLGLVLGSPSAAAQVSTVNQSSAVKVSGTVNHSLISSEDLEPVYDEVMHYLISIAPAIRRLPPEKQSLARIKIQTLLHDLEFS